MSAAPSSPPSVEPRDLPLSAAEVYGGLRRSLVAGCLGMAFFAQLGGVSLTLLMEALTGRGVLVGLAVTLQQAAMFVQIPAALLFTRVGRRKRLWVRMAVAHRALWLLPAFAPLFLAPPAAAWSILAVVFVSTLLAQAATPAWYSWMADLIPPHISGRYWGLRQSAVTLSYLAALWASGVLLDVIPGPGEPHGTYAGFTLVFGFGALLGVGDILIHALVPEPPLHPPAVGLPLVRRVLAPLRDPDFRWLTAAMSAWYFSLGLVGSFSIVYLRREFGCSYTQLSALMMAGALGPVLVSVLHGHLVDRIGARTYGGALMIATPLLSLAWWLVADGTVAFRLPLVGTVAMPHPVAVFLIVNFLAGCLASGIGLCQVHLAAVLSRPEDRTLTMAVHWTLIGLTAAAGPLLGGAIMDAVAHRPLPWLLPFGPRMSFYHLLVLLHVLAIWCVAAPLFFRIRVREGEWRMRSPLGLVWPGNPMRAVHLVLQTYQAGFNLLRTPEPARTAPSPPEPVEEKTP